MLDLSTALHEWLAIPKDEQPADHYRLIGVRRFESDMNIVIACAEQRLRFLAQFDGTENAATAAELRQMLETARNELLIPTSKQAYDATLDGYTTPAEAAETPTGNTIFPATRLEGAPAAEPQSLTSHAEQTATPLQPEEPAQDSTGSWLVGRHRMCDVVVNSPYVSTRHCELLRTGEGYYLRDLESTNRTFVNGQLVAPGQLVRVTSEDIITLGKLTAMPWPPHVAR